MHPVLLQIGDFQLPTYGVVYSFAVILGIILSYRRAWAEGIDDVKFLKACLLAIIGIVVMSKVMHIIVSWDWYMDNPKRFLRFRTGHVFYGGYIGAVLFPLIYVKLIKEPFLPMLDVCATYMPLSLAVHRSLACMNAGCCYGKPTDVPWGITFPADAPASELYGQVPVHPTQLYEAGLGLVMFAILLAYRKHWRKVPGELFALQMLMYAIGRFVIEFFRGDTARGFYGPLSTSQWISIGMLLIFAALVVYIARERRKLKAELEKETTEASA